MTTTLKQFSRRELIKGLGAVGVLPALQVEHTLAQTTSAPVRVLFVALQHGWGISGGSNRSMSGDETNFNFPAGLTEFESIKDQCVIIDGVLTLGLWGNNHDLSYADILTAGVPNGETSSAFDGHMPLSVNPSMDYLLEQHSGRPAFRFSAGYRSWGTKHHPLSFDRNNAVLPYYTKAIDAYNSIFKDLPSQGGSNEPAVNQRETQLLSSIFDFIKNPAKRDIATLNSDEISKLESYLLAVNDLESKQRPIMGYSGSETLKEIPTTGQSSLEDLPQYLDMIKMGFANNITHSAVLGIGDINGIDKFHHDHAHGNTQTYWDTRNAFAKHIANFVKDLSSIVDTDGSMLIDNTIIVLTGEVGDGGHNVTNKGQIVIGGGGGKITRGRYLKQPVVSGFSNIQALRREDINGVLMPQITFGNFHTKKAGTRTNADLLRDIGNMAGLNLTQFGLPSQNKGTVLS